MALVNDHKDVEALLIAGRRLLFSQEVWKIYGQWCKAIVMLDL
jgi:hypothetical protein